MNPNAPSELLPQLLDDFYAECDEHLRDIRQSLVQLESSVGKAEPDAAVLEELFRSFHSFKGISAIVGLASAEALAHASEDYLRVLTRGGASLTSRGLELLMTAAQRLEQTVSAFRAKSVLPESESLAGSLQEIAARESSSGPSSEEKRPGSAGSSEAAEVENARSAGLVIWRCVFVPTPELDARGININSVRARLSKTGEILKASPRVRGQGAIEFEFLLGTRETPQDVTEWEKEGISVALVESPASTRARHAHPEEGIAAETHNPFISPSHVVRVDLHKLDELMRITGEMVIHRSRLEMKIAEATRRGLALKAEDLQEINVAMARSLRELRHGIMRVRLVPVAEIFARMPFVVRDLARDTKKQVKLKLEGQQTELDKYLIERLKDPLLHMVRNAFSHAVERPEERAAAGKPPEAVIRLRAFTVGDSVLIEVSDDGRGIDAKAIRKRAAGLKLLGPDVPNTLDNAALLRILCSPGFSTREDADRGSGRGVGMSVVYETVRELGGTITLETASGKGSTFCLRLPLTLAIAETFIVSSAEQTCAIPQSFVREVMHVEENQIRTVNRTEVVPYRSGVLPVIRLAAMFNRPEPARERRTLLVLTSERGRTGLLVDRVHGQREVVVRALRDPLVQVPGVVGATELGDGRPVLILDGSVLTSGAVAPESAESPETSSQRSI